MALSIPLLMSMSEAFSVPFYTLLKLCYIKALEWSSLVPGPKAKSSEITNPTSFTVRYQWYHWSSINMMLIQWMCLYSHHKGHQIKKKKCNHIKEYKTIYWPLFTSIYNKVNNIQLNNILITTKLLFFLASAELVTQNTEKVEPSCKEWIGVKSEKTCRSSID